VNNISRNKALKDRGFIKKASSYKEFGVLMTLVVLCVVVGALSRDWVFFTPYNLLNVLRQISVMAIIAVGQAFVMISGGIDLSVGSFLSFGGVFCAFLIMVGVNPWLALVITLAVGFLLGTINGLIIVKLKLNAFITTLAMLNIVKGLAYLVTKGIPIDFENSITFLGGEVGSIPVPVIIMFVVIILGHVLLTKTVFGRYVFAVGGNEKASKLSGIPVEKTRLLVYGLIGSLGAFTGVITAANLMTADTGAGLGYDLDVIAATVIGGVSVSGGKGSVPGVLIGAGILGVIRNGFVLLLIPSYWQMMSIGMVIILACAFDQFRASRR